MAEYVEIVISAILAGGISAVFLVINKLSKTSDDTIVDSVDVRHAKERLEELFRRVEKICERMEKLETSTQLHEYRLDRLDSGEKS